MSGIQDVESQLLQGVDGGPLLGGPPGTNAHDGGYALFGGNLKDPNSKDVLLVPLVNTRDNSVKATSVPRIDVAGLQILPLAGAFQGGRSPMALTERQSRKPPVPDLRLDVMTDAILPLVRNLFDFSFPV